MATRLPILIVTQEKNQVFKLKELLEQSGQEVIIYSSESITSIPLNQIHAGAVLLTFKPETEALIETLRSSHNDLSLFVLVFDSERGEPSPALGKKVRGVFHPQRDDLEFIAEAIVKESRLYQEKITPPFFNALLRHTEKASQSWHCPGHSGGAAFLKSPVGKIFHNYFGENMLKADVCNAVERLGQLLDHTGPIAQSERNAAEIFNSDHLYFVTNGTSTSNKIVWQSMVNADDIVVVDRNCHKSVLHAIMMTGATPIYLMPTRNHYGLIGPIPESDFSFDHIQKKIEQNPFIKDKSRKPRILTITQSTYDGIIYNVEAIKGKLDGKVHALHFDEAWLPHANFHPLYKNMHAIGKDRPRAKHSLIFSTQSTHKVLAGLSQASQILVIDAENKKLNHHIFNESYMMHTSTSPQYSIIASCDVSAQMMKGAQGEAIVQESITEAIAFRKAMRALEQNHQKDWWFKIWGPDELAEENLERSDWILNGNQGWHGFGEISENFNMLDPIKGTILTPGIKGDGNFDASGIPASIVAKYLAEYDVIVEKYGLYSLFIMFTIGITRDRWQSLIQNLEMFKGHYDDNCLLSEVMPKFSKENPQYSDFGLKDICQSIHEEFKEHNIVKMTTEMYISDLSPVMKPSEAFAMMAHEEVERVEIHDLEGRATAVLLTPYPPGIPLLIPGERFNKAVVNYLKFSAAFNKKFPGLETDVHGLVTQGEKDGRRYFVDCLKT